MTRHLAGLTLAIALAGGAAQPAAHEKFRIVGTVVKVQATELDVKAGDGQVYEIDMDEKTTITRDKKKVAVSELKAGRRVVVDALGHDIFDLVAVDVQLVASPDPVKTPSEVDLRPPSLAVRSRCRVH